MATKTEVVDGVTKQVELPQGTKPNIKRVEKRLVIKKARK